MTLPIPSRIPAIDAAALKGRPGASFVGPELSTQDGSLKEYVVKGLMFNLLENLATEAGCSDEAWELVAEFAAAEALLDQAANPRPSRRPSRIPLSYGSPAEAMVRCLSQGELTERRSWDLMDAAQHQEWFGTDWNLSANARTQMTETDAFGAGFAAEAFLEPDTLLGAWRRDSEHPPVDRTFDEEEQADEWIRQQKAAQRRKL